MQVRLGHGRQGGTISTVEKQLAQQVGKLCALMHRRVEIGSLGLPLEFDPNLRLHAWALRGKVQTKDLDWDIQEAHKALQDTLKCNFTPESEDARGALRTAFNAYRKWLDATYRQVSKLATKSNWRHEVQTFLNEVIRGWWPGQVVQDLGHQHSRYDRLKALEQCLYRRIDFVKQMTPAGLLETSPWAATQTVMGPSHKHLADSVNAAPTPLIRVLWEEESP